MAGGLPHCFASMLFSSPGLHSHIPEGGVERSEFRGQEDDSVHGDEQRRQDDSDILDSPPFIGPFKTFRRE
jgi:hypothetical protein